MALTKKELEVLDILCKNINKNISYEYLKDIVWINKNISDSTVQNVVSRLKKKLDDINPDYAIGKFQSKQTYYKI